MEADIIIAIAIAAAAVLIVNQLGRVLRAMMLHRTIRKGMIHGSAITPELLAKIEEQKPAGGFGDDRIGLVLMALAAAIIGFAALSAPADDFKDIIGVSLFPLFVGAVLFGRHWYNRRRGLDA
ncbi:MAG: hypothetical protein ACJ8ER_04590 [Allosphingosinicella sp.]